MFLAEGFEEIEALCPLDLMRRAKIEVKTVGVGTRLVKGAHAIVVEADMTTDELDRLGDLSCDMVFLPGGMPGTLNLAACDTVINAVSAAAKNGSYIAAICAAPSILGDMGLLCGKEAICYPGFEDRLKGAVISKDRVALDGRILTAAGMGAALDMGLKIVEIFKGEQQAMALRHAVIAD